MGSEQPSAPVTTQPTNVGSERPPPPSMTQPSQSSEQPPPTPLTQPSQSSQQPPPTPNQATHSSHQPPQQAAHQAGSKTIVGSHSCHLPIPRPTSTSTIPNRRQKLQHKRGRVWKP